ncbi:MAG TPA: hypothetical protein VGE53_02255 [Candidatus Paceibacterota bacterium]
MKLLRAILDLLFPPRDAEALVNGATQESLGALVRVRTHDDGTVSLLPYRAPQVKACITETKFRDSENAQTLLASVLREYVAALEEDLESFEAQTIVVVPVPLSEARRKERGYNQTERIATKALSGLADTTLNTKILVRTRDTLPQTSLGGRERRENLKDAFEASIPDATHTYIVFDDVRTTGTTLSEAVQALKNAGALKVYGLSLAH